MEQNIFEKEMITTFDNRTAAIIGSSTGLLHYLTHLDNGQFIDKLVSGLIIAIFCGMAGIVGKNIGEYILGLFKKNKTK
jgi:hypothetical protein